MTTTPTANLARDPVCGMNVNPDTAKHVLEYAGKNYYFCCAGCLKKFESDPAGYLNRSASSGLVKLGMPESRPAASAPSHLSPRAEPPFRDSGTKAQSRDVGSGVAVPAYVCP